MKSKVDIVVERQWHAPSLAKALLAEDRLGHVITGFPKSRYAQYGVPVQKIISRPLPALWNFAISRLRLPQSLRVNEALSLASFASQRMTAAPVVTCLATSYQYLFPKILNRPTIRVIECGSMHPEDHFLFQQRGRKEAGLSYSDQLPEQARNEAETSQLAHFLVCGSKMVVESYVQRGYAPTQVLHCPYGVDTNLFALCKREPPLGRPIRIATVGVIGIRKGIVRLLRLAELARLRSIPVEFHLIGPVEAEAETIIARSHAHDSIVRRGVLKGNQLVRSLHEADIYCLPSYEEGFPISQLEAMSTGLASITSNDTGGRETVSDGVNGLILSEFAEAEFDAKVLPWFKKPECLVAAGRAAAIRAKSLYSSKQYTDSVLRCYGIALEHSARMLSGEKISSAYNQ